MAVKEGMTVRILVNYEDASAAADGEGVWHSFPVGSVATAINDRGDFSVEDLPYNQYLHHSAYEVINTPQTLEPGDKVKVLNNHVWSHGFDDGAILEFIVEDSKGTYEFKEVGDNGKYPFTQVLHETEFRVLTETEQLLSSPANAERLLKAVKQTETKKETQVVSKETIATKEDQGKLLYVVIRQADNRVIHSTHDRDFAREVKAEFGGKKEGYVIITHKAVQEIR